MLNATLPQKYQEARNAADAAKRQLVRSSFEKECQDFFESEHPNTRNNGAGDETFSLYLRSRGRSPLTITDVESEKSFDDCLSVPALLNTGVAPLEDHFSDADAEIKAIDSSDASEFH